MAEIQLSIEKLKILETVVGVTSSFYPENDLKVSLVLTICYKFRKAALDILVPGKGCSRISFYNSKNTRTSIELDFYFGLLLY